MTKEEYLASMKAFKEEEYAARRKQIALYKDYVAANRQFNPGDKVLVTYTDGHAVEAFASTCGVHDDGDLYYGLKKVNRDGTMSNHRLPYRDHDKRKIELLEPAKN